MPSLRWPRVRLAALVFVLLALTAACGGPSAAPAALPAPQPSAGPTGAVPSARLKAMLVQPADLAGLGQRRVFASNAVTTLPTPQLALCHPTTSVGPHELANVIAESAQPGGVKVFEIVSVFADEAAAKAAYAVALADARGCTSYASSTVAYRVQGLASVDVGAGATAVHYALITSDVVSGDVRTLARRGSYTVLISGFGRPPTGQPLLAYQADVMRKALARLG